VRASLSLPPWRSVVVITVAELFSAALPGGSPWLNHFSSLPSWGCASWWGRFRCRRVWAGWGRGGQPRSGRQPGLGRRWGPCGVGKQSRWRRRLPASPWCDPTGPADTCRRFPRLPRYPPIWLGGGRREESRSGSLGSPPRPTAEVLSTSPTCEHRTGWWCDRRAD
jgi:hypothetical protein